MNGASSRLLAGLRALHIYLAMLAAIPVVFVAATGLVLNHKDYFLSGEPAVHRQSGTLPAELLGKTGIGGQASVRTEAAQASDETPHDATADRPPGRNAASSQPDEQGPAGGEPPAAAAPGTPAPGPEALETPSEPRAPQAGDGHEEPPPAGPKLDPVAIVARLRADFAIRGSMTSFEPDEQEIRVVFKRPGRRTDVLIDRADGRVELTGEDRGALGWLTDLHKGADAGRWRWLLDGVAGLLLFAAVSGFVLWIRLPKRRLIGSLALVAGLATWVLVYLLVVP